MKKNAAYLVFSIALLFANVLYSQTKHTLSGTIKEASSNETIIGVTIAIPELQIGAITNEYGFYSITVPEGTHQLQVSFLGFKEISKEIQLKSGSTLDFFLEESATTLEEVIIVDEAERISIKKPEMSVNKLSINTIKKMPVIFGEVDVIKSLVLLPGVTNAGEGSSGFNVRGGAVDQNLILLDEATLYSSSHLFGFFSVFNPDAIKDLKLYKGGIPARYGGRVASVLDIYQKDGNSKSFHGQGGIGLISSRLLLEGPITEDKGSFLFAGRSSYAHLFLPLFDIESIAYFYDVNTKLTYELDDKNTLLLSGYFGRDVFSLSDTFVNTYGNTLVNLRWNHLFSDKLFSNLSTIYSDYYYGIKLDFIGFNWESGIQNFNIKYDLKHYLNNTFKLNYGLNSTYFDFNPGEIKPIEGSDDINPEQLTKKYAVENALYFGVEQTISSSFSAEYGIRHSSFLRFGQDGLNTYANDQAVIFNKNLGIYEKAIPTGTSFKSGKIIKTFNNFEPRLSLAYSLNNNTSFKASYNRITQYLHLLSNTTSPTPLDVWTPSGPYAKPQKVDQWALGFFKNLKDNEFTLQVETYYKEVQNRINYIDGADLIANEAIEQVMLNGEARAYGLEVLLTKNKNGGKFSGWLAYTLAKSEERTPGRTALEPGLNNGRWYASNYDKRHDISLTVAYDLSKKWSLSSNFSLQTGQPTTYPNSNYSYETFVVPNFGARNSNRLPTYHRLDLSATYIRNPQKKSGLRGEWVFGVYNLYNRKNANSITFQQNQDTGRNEAIKLSIFGIIPAISYNFKF